MVSVSTAENLRSCFQSFATLVSMSVSLFSRYRVITVHLFLDEPWDFLVQPTAHGMKRVFAESFSI